MQGYSVNRGCKRDVGITNKLDLGEILHLGNAWGTFSSTSLKKYGMRKRENIGLQLELD